MSTIASPILFLVFLALGIANRIAVELDILLAVFAALALYNLIKNRKMLMIDTGNTIAGTVWKVETEALDDNFELEEDDEDGDENTKESN